MNFNFRPTHLKNNIVQLSPLQEIDFDRLFAVGCDPEIWKQHPISTRYQEPVFRTYFEGAIASKGAFLITETETNEVVGCSRFYDFNADEKSIKIGYTFIGTKYWGKNINKNIKKLMIDYVFETLENVIFEVGAQNYRSQKAIEKIGAVKIGEREITLHQEDSKLNYLYRISKL